jgi:predicted DNA-binding WGR domain protein
MRQLALFCPDPAELVPLAINGGARLVSIDPKKNRYRFYTIVWQQTLWNDRAIQTTWGRIGGFGRSRVAYFECEKARREALAEMVARRLARGYRLTDTGRSTGGSMRQSPESGTA